MGSTFKVSIVLIISITLRNFVVDSKKYKFQLSPAEGSESFESTDKRDINSKTIQDYSNLQNSRVHGKNKDTQHIIGNVRVIKTKLPHDSGSLIFKDRKLNYLPVLRIHKVKKVPNKDDSRKARISKYLMFPLKPKPPSFRLLPIDNSEGSHITKAPSIYEMGRFPYKPVRSTKMYRSKIMYVHRNTDSLKKRNTNTINRAKKKSESLTQNIIKRLIKALSYDALRSGEEETETATEETKPEEGNEDTTKDNVEEGPHENPGNQTIPLRPPWLGSINYNAWTYFKKIFDEEDCPPHQARISGVCSWIPPHRK